MTHHPQKRTCKYPDTQVYSCLNISTGLSLIARKDGTNEEIILMTNEVKQIIVI